MKKIKYALHKFSTHNIGDEIQSIAARQFLPRIDYYIDRDGVGDWKNNNPNEEVRLIANGWYMHDPMAWPINDKTLKPLMTSVHLNETDESLINKFSSKGSVDYLKSLGQKIGARDKTTEKIFKELGLDAVFSGCLTLTLERDPDIDRADYILCVTTSDEVYSHVKANTERPVIKIDTLTFDEKLNHEEKLNLAEQYLFLYQSAHLVVTTRLHAMLPCLSFETPVIHISDSGPTQYDPSRLDGLAELTNNMTEKEFLSNIKSADLENPKTNPVKYKIIRKKLTKTCEEFIGEPRKHNTFARNNDFKKQKLENNDALKLIIYNYDQEKYLLAEKNKNLVKIEKNLQKEVERLSEALANETRRSSRLKAEVDQLNSIKASFIRLMKNINRRMTG